MRKSRDSIASINHQQFSFCRSSVGPGSRRSLPRWHGGGHTASGGCQEQGLVTDADRGA